MPLFSYHCTDCQGEFEALVLGSDRPACPQCGGTALEQLLSRVAPEPRVAEPAGVCGTCGQFGPCMAAGA